MQLLLPGSKSQSAKLNRDNLIILVCKSGWILCKILPCPIDKKDEAITGLIAEYLTTKLYQKTRRFIKKNQQWA